MSETEKQANRVMGEYSIAKSFKGILRIAHIIDLVKNEEDRYFNPTYYGIPNSLVDLSKGKTESGEKGHRNPKDGMDGSISRYTFINEDGVITDDLRHLRVPMTDSMGNYLNWNIGLDGVTIGSDENINGSAIDVEPFKQRDLGGSTNKATNYIWHEKYFPVLSTKEIKIGLRNKDHPSDKFRINQDSGLIIQQPNAKLIIENAYDKTTQQKSTPVTLKDPLTGTSKETRQFIKYQTDEGKRFRTIYQDNKSKVENYDVFMYRQDDYDVHNYGYSAGNIEYYKFYKNDEVLSNFNENGTQKKTLIDANVGIVNLKEYVFDMVQKFMGSSLVEVPTGAIINQYISLDKWYSYPDTGDSDEYGTGSYPGHRPAMMAKRNVNMLPKTLSDGSDTDRNNAFTSSTIMGACRKINKLKNTNYNSENHTTNTNGEKVEEDTLTYGIEGFHKEIIPLYKRDYVLCDGSTYAIYLFPKNFETDSYPNRRESLDRFLNLFYAIGYHYTDKTYLLNNRFNYQWNEDYKYYEILNNKDQVINSSNCLKIAEGEPGVPNFDKSPDYVVTDGAKVGCDLHSLFVEDFLTILAFEAIYDKVGQASNINFVWNKANVNKWLSEVELPEQYRLNTFVGDSDLEGYDNPLNLNIQLMQLPYYNFNNDGSSTKDNSRPLPIINLGREIKNFGDPIKFYDHTKGKYVIIKAYMLPQIQYIVDLFTSDAVTDVLAPVMSKYFCYNFQVPNLMQKQPVFIGSSGIDWADSQMRKVKTPKSWSSSYSWSNYPHRHFIFQESNKDCKEEGGGKPGEYKEMNPGYDGGKGPARYKASQSISPNTHVAAAAWWNGSKVMCSTTTQAPMTFDYGQGEHANYIWNELGAGVEKDSNVTFAKETVLNNGMTYTILQANIGDDFHFYPTGSNRNVKKETQDFIQNTENKTYESFALSDEIWNVEDIVLEGKTEFLDAKAAYEIDTYHGWEHFEDPRFESAEPNRGRTSPPVQIVWKENCMTLTRYEKNKECYTEDNAEWFSPESVKMLPLIKL